MFVSDDNTDRLLQLFALWRITGLMFVASSWNVIIFSFSVIWVSAKLIYGSALSDVIETIASGSFTTFILSNGQFKFDWTKGGSIS